MELLPQIFSFELLVFLRTICQPGYDLVGLESPLCLVMQLFPCTGWRHLCIFLILGKVTTPLKI